MNPKQMTWSNLKVGVVIFLGLIVFVFIVTVVGTEQNIFSSTTSFRLFMPNVRGLVNGAMVTLGGLKIGYVNEMRFVTRDGVNGVEVTIGVLTKYRETITSGSLAQVKTIGLLGDKYIDLSIGSEGEQPLEESAFIPLKESFDIEEAGPQLKVALEDFTEILRHAKTVGARLARGEGSVGKFLADDTAAREAERFLGSLNRVMAALEQRRGALGEFLYNEALGRNVGQLSDNLRAVTDSLRHGKGTAGKLLMDDSLYGSLARFAARADTLLARAAADSSNVSKMVSDPEFYTRLVVLMRDLNLLLVDLREHPERYVHVSVF